MSTSLPVLFLDSSILKNKRTNAKNINTLVQKLGLYIVFVSEDKLDTDIAFLRYSDYGLDSSFFLDHISFEKDSNFVKAVSNFLNNTKRHIDSYFIISSVENLSNLPHAYTTYNNFNNYEANLCYSQFYSILQKDLEDNEIVKKPQIKVKSKQAEKVLSQLDDLTKEALTAEMQINQANCLLNEYDFTVQKKYKSRQDLYTDFFKILNKNYDKLSKKDINSILKSHGIVTPVSFYFTYMIPFMILILVALWFLKFGIIYSIVALVLAMAFDYYLTYFFQKTPSK